MGKAWMSKGKDAIKKKEEARGAGSTNTSDWFLVPRRFYMDYSTTKDLVFVDDEGVGVYEHAPYINGSRLNNWFTCPESGSECCEAFGAGFKDRYLIVFYTIVNCSPWVDKDGNEHNYGMELFGAKFGTYEKLDTKKTEEGGLAGKLVRARRYSQTMEPNVGSEHNIVREIESAEGLFRVTSYRGQLLSKLFDEAEDDPDKMARLKLVFDLRFDEDGNLIREVPAFNYDEILAPPSDDEIEAKITAAGKAAGNSNGGTSSQGAGAARKKAKTRSFAADDEDVPF